MKPTELAPLADLLEDEVTRLGLTPDLNKKVIDCHLNDASLTNNAGLWAQIHYLLQCYDLSQMREILGLEAIS